MLERTRVGLLSLWPNRSVTDSIGEGPGPGREQHCSEASSHDNMLSASVPWQVVLANAGDSLSREDLCSIAEVCKDAFYQVRHNAQSKLAVNLSEAYNLQLVKADTTLVARYPHVSDLCLCMDTDVLEDQDEASTLDGRMQIASYFLIRGLGTSTHIKSLRISKWEALNASMVTTLQLKLPSLQALYISEAERLDLATLSVSTWSGLTKLHLSAYTINVTADALSSLAGLAGSLVELKMDGLQLNDQKADNAACTTLAALTHLTRLELVSFSACVSRCAMALPVKNQREGTLRTAPWGSLGPALGRLTQLSHLMLCDQGFSAKASNALLQDLAQLPSLSVLHMPEARVRDSGWSALTQLSALTDLHLYSLEVKGQKARASAGRVTWWRRLRLDDTCLPELAAVMPLPGLESFIGTMYMRYGEESIPPSDLAGWQKVHSCLAAAKEVRLWLETDCDVWSGLAAALQGIPCLKEVVVRTRPPHTFNEADLERLVSSITACSLHYLDLFGSALSDQGLQHLQRLPHLTKVCLGVSSSIEREGHTLEGVQGLARVMAGRGKPALIVAHMLMDSEVLELDDWAAETLGSDCCVIFSNDSNDYFKRMDL